MSEIDIKYINVPNVCFSLTKENDEREIEFSIQRKKRGFDDSETWSLCDTIANFAIPRLERYIQITDGFIKRTEKEQKQIQQFLEALKLVSRDNGSRILTKKEWKKVFKGLKQFPEIFLGLWW